MNQVKYINDWRYDIRPSMHIAAFENRPCDVKLMHLTLSNPYSLNSLICSRFGTGASEL